MNVDLTTPEGFRALEQHAADTIVGFYSGFSRGEEDHWDELAGRDLHDVAASLADDFMQQSVSLPRGAFADPERAGRELQVIRQVYAYVAYQMLREVIGHRLGTRAIMPAGTHPAPVAPHHRRK